MKKFLLVLVLISANAFAVSLEKIEGHYEGKRCTVDITINGDKLDVIIDGSDKISMRNMDLEIAQDRINNGEKLYTGSMGNRTQKFATLNFKSGKLSSVYATETRGYFSKTEVKCKRLVKRY